MPTFSLPVYMLHSLHPYSHANTSLITTLLSNAHLTHSFPHHPTFIVSYPYIPSIHPIPTISTMFIFPHHTLSIPIFQFHHSAHLSYSFIISPICPRHAWIHMYISPWAVPLIFSIPISIMVPLISTCCFHCWGWCPLSQNLIRDR